LPFSPDEAYGTSWEENPFLLAHENTELDGRDWLRLKRRLFFRTDTIAQQERRNVAATSGDVTGSPTILSVTKDRFISTPPDPVRHSIYPLDVLIDQLCAVLSSPKSYIPSVYDSIVVDMLIDVCAFQLPYFLIFKKTVLDPTKLLPFDEEKFDALFNAYLKAISKLISRPLVGSRAVPGKLYTESCAQFQKYLHGENLGTDDLNQLLGQIMVMQQTLYSMHLQHVVDLHMEGIDAQSYTTAFVGGLTDNIIEIREAMFNETPHNSIIMRVFDNDSITDLESFFMQKLLDPSRNMILMTKPDYLELLESLLFQGYMPPINNSTQAYSIAFTQRMFGIASVLFNSSIASFSPSLTIENPTQLLSASLLTTTSSTDYMFKIATGVCASQIEQGNKHVFKDTYPFALEKELSDLFARPLHRQTSHPHMALYRATVIICRNSFFALQATANLDDVKLNIWIAFIYTLLGNKLRPSAVIKVGADDLQGFFQNALRSTRERLLSVGNDEHTHGFTEISPYLSQKHLNNSVFMNVVIAATKSRFLVSPPSSDPAAASSSS
jgi:hypothetical protein